MTTKYSSQFKKQLTTRVEACSLTEQAEIFKIIKDLCVFTQNKNGIFLNLTNIDDSIIDKIVDYVSFSQQNKSDFAEHDKKVNEFKLIQSVPETTLKSILSDGCKDDWEKLVTDAKNNEKVQKFVNQLNISRNTQAKPNTDPLVKRGPSLFSNACKKFARRAMSTKKNEHDFVNELVIESFNNI